MRWVWRAEAGAGKVEYGALVLLVAAITAAVIGFGLAGDVRALYDRALCLLPGDEECEDLAAGDESGAGEDEPENGSDGGDGSEEGDGGDGSEEGDGGDGSEEGDGSGGGDGDEEPGDDSGQDEEEGNYDPELAEELEEAQSDLEDAEGDLEDAQSDFDDIKDELLQLLKELIGLQDAEDCLTEGDIVACIWTVVGFAPWGKAAKVAKKIPAIARLVTKWRRRSGRLDDAQDHADNVRRDRDELLQACRFGGSSFPAETPVILAGGATQAIADIDAGDYVVAADPETGTSEPQPVTHTMLSFGVKDLVTLTVLTDGGGHQITATDDHLFWDDGRQEWIEAAALHPGDQLRTPEGGAVTVAGLAEFTQRQTVHNLTVHNLHTYHVGAGAASVLVHNQAPGCVTGYSGHARQRMSQRGISEDMVEQTVASGKKSRGNSPGTTKYKSGKLWVVLNSEGKVVSLGRN